MAPRWVLGVLAGITILAFGLLEVVRWLRILAEETALNRKWSEAVCPIDDIRDRFPSETNESAQWLEKEIARMGLLRPPSFVTLAEEQSWRASRPSDVDRAAIEDSMPAVWSYVEESLRAGDDERRPIPPDAECLL